MEGIVAAAIELADAEGLAAVSMSRVADRLGFTTMSLYRYVSAKQDLIELMVDRACVPPPTLEPDANADADARGGAGSTSRWRHAIECWARQLSELFHTHPWLLQADLPAITPGPNRLALLETALAALSTTELSAHDKLAAVLTVEGCVRTSVQLAQQLAADDNASAPLEGRPVGGPTTEHRGASPTKEANPEPRARAYPLRSFVELGASYLDPDHFPELPAALEELASLATNRLPVDTTAVEPLGLVDFALRTILDGLAVLIEPPC